jgi:hypothetical protein
MHSRSKLRVSWYDDSASMRRALEILRHRLACTPLYRVWGSMMMLLAGRQAWSDDDPLSRQPGKYGLG